MALMELSRESRLSQAVVETRVTREEHKIGSEEMLSWLKFSRSKFPWSENAIIQLGFLRFLQLWQGLDVLITG